MKYNRESQIAPITFNGYSTQQNALEVYASTTARNIYVPPENIQGLFRAGFRDDLVKALSICIKFEISGLLLSSHV